MRTLRFRIIVALLVVTAFGLAMKYYAGPAAWFVNDWGPPGVAYELFFMLLAFLVVPRRGAITPIAVGVCVVTCALEAMQLWQPPWLQAIRSGWLGKALLGTTFSWWDMPAYVIGCVLGWFLLHAILAQAEPRTGPGMPIEP